MAKGFGRAKRTALAAVFALVLAGTLAPSAFALPPANDMFAAGELLTGTSATATGSTTEATKETGEPIHVWSGGASVWYRWTASSDGIVTVDTFGSSFDTTLAAYTGLTVDGLHRLAANDDYNGTRSRVRIPVTAGQEYHFVVDGFAGSRGSVTLHLNFGSSPPNDNLANAVELTGASVTAGGTNLAASKEPGEPTHAASGGVSVWWTWTAPSTGGVTMSTAGSTFNTTLAAYTGDTVSGLVAVASNNDAGTGTQSVIRFRAIAGATYRIAVDGLYGAEGSIALSLDLQPPPPNDDFATATVLAGTPNDTATGTNVGAGVEAGEPSHYSYEAARASVWYAWTAPSDGSLTLRADGGFSRALAVYTGTQVSSLTRVPNQAQNYSGGPEQIRVRVQAGVTYAIVLDGRAASAGTFNLTLTLIGRPANDDFVDAETLVGLSAETTGSNVGATQEPGEPIHEENYYDPSVWYQWTAPSSGGVTVDSSGSTFNSVVAVYTGTSVSTLTRVPSTRVQTTQEKRYFRAAAGVTYRIAVDGRNAQQGAIELELTEIPPPANDLFVAAQAITPGDTVFTGNTLGATGENGEPGSGGTAGATVWYRFTAAQTGRATVRFATADFPGTLAVYTGEAVDSLTSVPTSSGRWRTVAGTTYSIAVGGGARPDRGFFGLKLGFTARPANDDFVDAEDLEGDSDSATGSNVAATREPGEPSHSYGAQSVWWEWTAPTNGRATINVSGSFDWVAAVYTGSTVGTLTRVRSTSSGALVFPAVAGTTYRVAVDGWSTSATYDEGSISLSLSLVDPPPNDNFADATVLAGSSDDVTGSSLNGSRESYEPYHAGWTPHRSVWYRWRAPATGPVTIDTAGSAFDTVLGVYQGSSVGSLSWVASNEDNPSGSPQARVTFNATAGTVVGR